jgi:hypothetical protein
MVTYISATYNNNSIYFTILTLADTTISDTYTQSNVLNQFINVMNLDLFKYIMKLSIVPMMFVSLVLITHGTDDNIDVINIIGYILLIITSVIIFNIAKDEDK